MDRYIDVNVRVTEDPGEGSITMTKSNGESEVFPLGLLDGVGFMAWLVPLVAEHRAARAETVTA